MGLIGTSPRYGLEFVRFALELIWYQRRTEAYLRGCRVTRGFEDHVAAFSKSTMTCALLVASIRDVATSHGRVRSFGKGQAGQQAHRQYEVLPLRRSLQVSYDGTTFGNCISEMNVATWKKT